MPRERWAHYTNTCRRCNGDGWLYSPKKKANVQCSDCEGTGYGLVAPPRDGSPGSANVVVTQK